MFLKNIGFQYYSANIKDPYPKGFVSIGNFIKSIKEPNNKFLDIFERIANAELEGDLTTKKELKTKYLYAFTPCVIVNGIRSYNNILLFTGLMVLDFDHVAEAEQLKRMLFKNFKFIICVYLSPSKQGVKALLRIPQCLSTEEFKEYYFGLQPFVENFKGFDATTKNCVLPLFSSYDPELLYRDDATIFDLKGEDPFPLHYVDPTKIVIVKPDNKQQELVIKKFKAALVKIVDNGHPQLRSACRALGGYCGAGYLTEQQCTDLITYEVSLHPYFKNDLNNYLKTSIRFLKNGMNMPLYL